MWATYLDWNTPKLILTMKETFFYEIMRFLARKAPKKKTMLTQFRWWHKVQQPGSPQRRSMHIDVPIKSIDPSPQLK